MNKKSVLSELQFFWCGFGDGGHVLGMTRAHPVVEASVLVGDTDDDDGDGTATSPPHVSYLSRSLYSPFPLIGPPWSRDLNALLLLPLPF